jgi:hypothetical protein
MLFARRRSSVAGPRMRLKIRYGKPSFMIPGAQKCGTTALAVFLQRHPRLRLSEPKEPDFFLRDSRYLGRGLDHYRTYFRRTRLPGRELFFEASAGYVFYPSVPRRLAEFDPDLRFVLMVREPSSRAYSAWNMYRELCTVPSERRRMAAWLEDHNPADRESGLAMLAEPRFPSFLESVERELAAIERGEVRWSIPALVPGGLYADQLARFLDAFPRESFLVLEDRELLERPRETLDRVAAFLDLPEHDWGDDFPRVHTGRYEEHADGAALERLRAFYAPHNERFYGLAGRRFAW